MNEWTSKCEGVKKSWSLRAIPHYVCKRCVYLWFRENNKIDGRAPSSAWARERKNELNRKKIISGFFFLRIFSIVIFHYFVGFGRNSVCSIHHYRKKSNAAPRRRRWRREKGWSDESLLPPIYQYTISMRSLLLLLFFHHQIYIFYVFATFACISLSVPILFRHHANAGLILVFSFLIQPLAISFIHMYTQTRSLEVREHFHWKKTKGDESNPKKDQPKEWKEWAKYCAVSIHLNKKAQIKYKISFRCVFHFRSEYVYRIEQRLCAVYTCEWNEKWNRKDTPKIHQLRVFRVFTCISFTPFARSRAARRGKKMKNNLHNQVFNHCLYYLSYYTTHSLTLHAFFDFRYNLSTENFFLSLLNFRTSFFSHYRSVYEMCTWFFSWYSFSSLNMRMTIYRIV